MDITAYAGENIKIATTVLDDTGNPADIDGATAELAFNNDIYECEIEDGVVKVEIPAEDTTEANSYDYEIRLTDGDDIKTIEAGTIFIKPSLFTQTDA